VRDGGFVRGFGAHVFIFVLAALWAAPVLWTFYTSLRTQLDTNEHGYFSLAHSFTLQNYRDAWVQGQIPHFFLNSVIITVPAVVVTLFLASCVAFVVARFSFRFNVILLLMFTAGNLLPPQTLLSPLFKIYTNLPVPHFLSDSGVLYDSYVGLIAINVAFQTGF
jgi:multiple sugar transport system permease protein